MVTQEQIQRAVWRDDSLKRKENRVLKNVELQRKIQRYKQQQTKQRLMKEVGKKVKAEQKLESKAKWKARKTKAVKQYKKIDKQVKNVERVAKKAFTGASEAYGYKKKLSSSLLNIGAGFTGGRPQQGQQKVQSGPGRPKAVYKHKDPQTGQPIPATLFYKRMKQVRREAQQQAQNVDTQQMQKYAKQGISPQEAQQIVNQQLQRAGVQTQQTIPQRVRQQMMAQQIQKQMQQQPQQQVAQQIPNKYPSQAVRPIWRNREGAVREDWGLFGRKKVVTGVPQSFWN